MRIDAEVLAFTVVAAAAIWFLVGLRPLHRVAATLAATVLVVLLSMRLWSPPAPTLAQKLAVPKSDDFGYVSSVECRACHPAQYASWHRSYHHTMTQVASRQTILAPYQPTQVEGRGRRFELFLRDGSLWARDVDPDALLVAEQHGAGMLPASLPTMEGPIVMTTGSHHMQIYWTRDARGLFRQLNWVWLKEDRRWVPTEDVYNQPRSGTLGIVGGGGSWIGACARCHATASRARLPGPGRPTADSRVAELGIACEACHGPAAAHVAANRNPARRYLRYEEDRGDSTIVNPARLDHVRSAQVCGQCHTVMRLRPNDMDSERGSAFRPGKDLDDYREVSTLEIEKARKTIMEVYYWPDGASRATGREYNAMIQSRCFTQGELDCVSCHSMHESDPDDQLAAGKQADGACLQCHKEYTGDRARAHTHHDAASSGSRCMNCHMANTTYGLLNMTRSHRIDSPVVAGVEGGQRPNACNLCHLDRTLAWTQEKMAAWYGTAPRALTEDEKQVPAGLLWLVSGNAVQRTAAAWSLGWKDAWAALPPAWGAPWLARTLDDPVAAVRYVAGKSLRRLPGFEEFRYDYLAPDPVQKVVVVTAARMADPDSNEKVESGRQALFDRLRASRDDQPIYFTE